MIKSTKIYLTLLFLLGIVGVQAQQAIFRADANAKSMVLNSYVEVTFTLENADGNNFKAPSFKDFKVVSGPSRSSRTSIVNGKVSKEISYGYSLQPQKEGTLTVASASITVGGKLMKTRPLQIKVVKGKERSAGQSSEEEYYVQAEANVTEAKVGQQVIIDYKLYTVINIDSYNVLEEPEYSGFYAQDIKRYNSRVEKEVIDGVQYSTKVLKKVALFPQQAGKLTIEPLELQLGILEGDPRQRRSFFSSGRVRRVPVSTEAITIDVTPLPENAPRYFTGAVGKYTVGMSVSANSLSTDDVLTVRLVVNGDGDTKRIQAPPFNLAVDSFEVYEPKAVEESIIEKQGQLDGQKIFEYLILPKYAGTFPIQPAFTYFDTDSLNYVTLRSNPYPINVKQGSQKERTIVNNQPEVEEDIRYIKMETTLKTYDNTFFGSGLFWGLTFFPFLLLGGAFVFRQVQEKQANIDPVSLKRKQAQKLARQRLKTAEVHLKSNNSGKFYDEISRGMFGYICAKLNIPLAELSKNNVRGKLQDLNVNSSHIEDFMKIISTCEMALFAGMDNSAAMQETYDKAFLVVTNIEEEILKNEAF